MFTIAPLREPGGSMKRLLPVIALIVALGPMALSAQTNYKTIYITPTDDGFEVYLAAAMTKKNVPVAVTTDASKANYTMKASEVEVTKVSTGTKVLSCLFAYCARTEDKGSTSVQVVDSHGTVKWSYAVNKGRGQKNRQSLAEAIAKHFKDEFAGKLPRR